MVVCVGDRLVQGARHWLMPLERCGLVFVLPCPRQQTVSSSAVPVPRAAPPSSAQSYASAAPPYAAAPAVAPRAGVVASGNSTLSSFRFWVTQCFFPERSPVVFSVLAARRGSHCSVSHCSVPLCCPIAQSCPKQATPQCLQAVQRLPRRWSARLAHPTPSDRVTCRHSRTPLQVVCTRHCDRLLQPVPV